VDQTEISSHNVSVSFQPRWLYADQEKRSGSPQRTLSKALGQKFFDRNIRAALSPDNAPNKKIREAPDRMATPAISHGVIFFRGLKDVFAVGEKR